MCVGGTAAWGTATWAPVPDPPLARPVLLTSPWMSGTAPMAFCSSRTSSTGPTMREVPVSTMASQPSLHRVRPLPTSTLQGKWACLPGPPGAPTVPSSSPGRRLSPLSGLGREQSGSRAQKPRAGSRPLHGRVERQQEVTRGTEGQRGPGPRPTHCHSPSQTDQGPSWSLLRGLLTGSWRRAPPSPERGSASTH